MNTDRQLSDEFFGESEAASDAPRRRTITYSWYGHMMVGIYAVTLWISPPVLVLFMLVEGDSGPVALYAGLLCLALIARLVLRAGLVQEVVPQSLEIRGDVLARRVVPGDIVRVWRWSGPLTLHNRNMLLITRRWPWPICVLIDDEGGRVVGWLRKHGFYE